MSQDRHQDALRSYSAGASESERAELAVALLSETPSMYRRYAPLPTWALWSSRTLAVPVAIWISLSISAETGASPFSRWSAFGGVAFALLLTTLPNWFSTQIGTGWAGRPPRTRSLPPGIAMFAGWAFFSILVVFARLLPDAV